MSYILEALKRADAERERGEVPTLQAQPASLTSADAAPALPSRPWMWMLGGGAVAAVVPIIVFLSMREPRTAPVAAGSPAASRAQWDSQPPAVQRPSPITSVTPPPAIPLDPGRAAPRTPPAAPAPAAAGDRPPAQRTTAAPAERRAAEAKKAPANRETAVPQEKSDPPVPALADLPREVRLGLPQVTVSGNMYSDRPENRMVVINGQLLRENDVLAPDLVLEEIRRKSVVLRYRGYRYEVPQ